MDSRCVRTCVGFLSLQRRFVHIIGSDDHFNPDKKQNGKSNVVKSPEQKVKGNHLMGSLVSMTTVYESNALTL